MTVMNSLAASNRCEYRIGRYCDMGAEVEAVEQWDLNMEFLKMFGFFYYSKKLSVSRILLTHGHGLILISHMALLTPQGMHELWCIERLAV